MNSSSSAPSQAPLDLADFDSLLARFEAAWRQGTPPRIESFVPAGSRDPRCRELLTELVLVDLNYRWRLPAASSTGWIDWNAAAATTETPSPNSPVQRLLLEDYLRQFPWLGPLDQLDPEVIGEEYRVRRRWGDRPGLELYLHRFPRQVLSLAPLLAAIDAELTAERSESIPLAATVAGPAAPVAGPIASVEALLDALRRIQLLSTAQLDQLRTEGVLRSFLEPRALAQELLRREWLTAYQVNQLFLGRESDLGLGSYLLLEPLGQGGTGRVFKARHQGLNRIVAVKVIRQELLADPEVVHRFYREMQLISQLTSPHVVHAFDAGPVGATHFLVMEYVEGTTLARLVKQAGPLPVPQATDYLRQAALGLQHIHAQGLVHRDIKPGNLIVVGSKRSVPTATSAANSSATSSQTAAGTIKILDLGLARCRPMSPQPADATAEEESTSSSLTPAGAVMMGTPDYLAPEQALDFHAADGRADLYSLGCTYFYLLTGQPPFPGGTLAKKLLDHQQLPPPPVEQFRRDLPPALTRVLHRLLAKQPQDRHQTAAELVRDLEVALAGNVATVKSAGPVAASRFGRVSRRWLLLPLVGGVVLLSLGAALFAVVGFVFHAPPTQPTVRRAAPAKAVSSYSLWDDRVTPTPPVHADTSANELGVKFRAEVAGSITALRFYKSAGNTGTHVGHLWDSDGKLLAKVTFANETPSGWQRANLVPPVAIKANVTYVASYHTTVGNYSADHHFFAGKGVKRGPLHALADGVSGGNGVFHSGASEFPMQTFMSTNYWVDVVFRPQ
jgi:serine/threonine protein kinase